MYIIPKNKNLHAPESVKSSHLSAQGSVTFVDLVRCFMSVGIKEGDAKAAILAANERGLLRITETFGVESSHAPEGATQTQRQHRWDNSDDSRCLDCGDKDWMNTVCSGPRVDAPEGGDERAKVISEWRGKELWWSINGEWVSDYELRAWIHQNLPYPHNIVDVIRAYQTDAYARRAKLPAPEGMGRDAKEFFKQNWGTKPLEEHEIDTVLARGLLVRSRLFQLMNEFALEVAKAHPTSESGTDVQHYLQNLLAVVHRDGGHYTAEHGLKKSAEDAEKIVANFIAKAESGRVEEQLECGCNNSSHQIARATCPVHGGTKK